MTEITAGRTRLATTGRVLLATLVGLVVAAAVAFGLLTARGGHVYVVQTPSMARTAPVGTLVVTEPLGDHDVRQGEIISFRPPGIGRVYTHRVVGVTDQGYRTKGDLNGSPDGWVVPRDRVVGRAAHLWTGLGWVLRCVPWTLLGLCVTGLVARLVRRRTRPAVWLAGSSLAVALALVVVRPLVRAETVGFVPAGKDGVKISAVATGLLSIRASAHGGGGHADLLPGQIAWVETHHADHGRYEVIPALHLPWWGWVIVGLVCAIPLVIGLLMPTDDEVPPGDGGATRVERTRRVPGRFISLS